ncbi:hypothetical protein RSAG8_04911, partial [Rhizoctonia solani AG-8 WAC10335]
MEGTRVRSLGREFRVTRGSPGVPEKYLHLTQRSLLIYLVGYHIPLFARWGSDIPQIVKIKPSACES